MVDYSKAKFYRILNDKMTMSILVLLVSHWVLEWQDIEGGGMAKIRNITNCYHTITQTFNAGGGEINMNIVKSSSELTGAF